MKTLQFSLSFTPTTSLSSCHPRHVQPWSSLLLLCLLTPLSLLPSLSCLDFRVLCLNSPLAGTLSLFSFGFPYLANPRPRSIQMSAFVISSLSWTLDSCLAVFLFLSDLSWELDTMAVSDVPHYPMFTVSSFIERNLASYFIDEIVV